MSEKSICQGCGRSFSPRGLRAHQSARFVTLACRPPKSPEEIKAEKVQTEYDRILVAAILKNGSVVNNGPNYYGWVCMDDYDLGPRGGWIDAVKHSTACGIASTGRIDDHATWYEFGGTDADPNYKIGMEVHGVTCNCGKLTDRVFRWDAPVGEAIKTVMMELLEERL